MKYRRILIVDDSATSRMIIKRCFEIAGFQDSEFYQVEDALKAVAFLQDNDVDLILSDLKMPKMDGSTFIKKLKAHSGTSRIPVVVISSMGNDVTEQELRNAGVEAVIRKPMTPEKVFEAVGGRP